MRRSILQRGSFANGDTPFLLGVHARGLQMKSRCGVDVPHAHGVICTARSQTLLSRHGPVQAVARSRVGVEVVLRVRLGIDGGGGVMGKIEKVNAS